MYKMLTIFKGIVSLEIDPVTNMARGKGFDFGIAVCFEKMELLEAFDRHATCEKSVTFEPTVRNVFVSVVCLVCRDKQTTASRQTNFLNDVNI